MSIYLQQILANCIICVLTSDKSNYTRHELFFSKSRVIYLHRKLNYRIEAPFFESTFRVKVKTKPLTAKFSEASPYHYRQAVYIHDTHPVKSIRCQSDCQTSRVHACRRKKRKKNSQRGVGPDRHGGAGAQGVRNL